MAIEELLKNLEAIINNGINLEGVEEILRILKFPIPMEILEEMELYTQYLPQNTDENYNLEKRCLHFLWDALDKTPMSVIANFAIPFRRMIAGKLFKSCGKNLIIEENVRFNVPDKIEMGDNVFINKGSFIDSKGGVKIGNSVAIGEGVTIFTHSHEEHDHAYRTYGQVVVGDYAKIYSNAVVLQGVNIEKQAIVAACSVVNKDVKSNTLVAGIPAKFMRERNNMEKNLEELKHIWLKNGMYQNEY